MERDALCVDPEQLPIVVELFEPRVEGGRLDGVGLLLELCNHVVEDGGVLLRLQVVGEPEGQST